MFRTMDDFLKVWENESAFTQLVLDALTDDSLKQEVAPGFRTLGRLAWHLTVSLEEIISESAGLQFEGAKSSDGMPDSAKEIAAAYESSNREMMKAIRENWSDATLTEMRNMYGEEWTIADVLWMIVTHQIHHRAQMTVLMRQAGLKVPGLYGPAKEDWAAMGAQAPKV